MFMTSYENFLQMAKEVMFEPYFYWQFAAVLVSLFATFVIYKGSKFLLLLHIKNNLGFANSILNKRITRYILPLLLPGLTIVVLVIGMLIFSKFYKDHILFTGLIEIMGLFLFLRFIRVFFVNSIIANLVAIFLVPTIILAIFGFLEPISNYLDSFAFTMGKLRISLYTVIKALIVLLIVFWLSGLISRKSKKYVQENPKINPNTKGVINKVIDLTVYFIVFVIILRVIGVDSTTFAVVGGAIGVGIGLGLQKIASNFIGGIILLFEKSIEIGDLVEINSGTEGFVTHFGSRYTLLETFDGKEIMVPNEDFIINKVVNLTYNNNRGRIEVHVGVAYDSDIALVQEIMVNAAKDHPRCLLYPTPEFFVTEFGEHAVRIIMYFWVNNVVEGRFRPRSDVMIEILKKFKENNIVIPLPQRDINFKQPLNVVK